MKRAAEIIHIVSEERKKYLEKYADPTEEIATILWNSGIRKQYYYEFGDEILRTYEYAGKEFHKDMQRINETEETRDFFISKRRRDVPEEERSSTNWWAPLKWYGSSVMRAPEITDLTMEEQYRSMISGGMDMESESEYERDLYSYDEDDWSESAHM